MSKQNKQQVSMIDLAKKALKEAGGPLEITQIFKYVINAKNEDINNYDLLAQFYTDMTTSGRFVYLENEKQWDLKENNLAAWDSASASYTSSLDYDESVVSKEISYDPYLLPDSFYDDEQEIGKPFSTDLSIEEDLVFSDDEEKEYNDYDIDIKSTDEDDKLDDDIIYDDEDLENYDDNDYEEDEYEDLY